MKRTLLGCLLLSLCACGVETEPTPDRDAGGSGGSGATSGSGGMSGTGGGGTGATSGTGGVGGDIDAGEDSGVDDGGVDAGRDSMVLPCGVMCSGSTPHCDETSMQCVACLNNDHCEGNSSGEVCEAGACVVCTASEGCASPLVCSSEGGACVECNVSAECGAEVCLDNGHVCVECNNSDDCDGAEGVCKSDNTCVACVESADCAGNPSGALCLVPNNSCVECLGDSDCDSAGEARCNLTTHQCVPCTENANCQGVMDGNTALNVCDSGICVECTATDYDQCGMGNLGQARVCNVGSGRCGGASQTEGSAGLCQPCVASAQCGAGQACVEQEFEDQTVGAFCFWRIGAAQGPNGSCLSVPPYARGLTNQATVEGGSANVCGLRNTTCPGINHFSNPMVQCAPGGVPNHDLCGFSYTGEGTAGNARDAYCEQVPNDTAYRCTVPCLSTDDCKVGSTCMSGSPDKCTL